MEDCLICTVGLLCSILILRLNYSRSLFQLISDLIILAGFPAMTQFVLSKFLLTRVFILVLFILEHPYINAESRILN